MNNPCKLCPRECMADRNEKYGFCNSKYDITVAGSYLHKWEEPCISGENGSGTIFFSGCTLKCVFCQNSKISRGDFGKTISPDRLAEIMLNLQEKGAENINLVTPAHFTDGVLLALSAVKDRLHIPVVFNCGGYEKVETLKRYEGFVDIYMPDFKYFDNALAKKYSSAPDYKERATEAIKEMIRQVGQPIFSDGLLKKGVLIRHLVLPGSYRDSICVLEHIKKKFGTEDILISLMSQFTPNKDCEKIPALNRKITTYEYQKVADFAMNLGFEGYTQEKSSATAEYIPPFNLEGI